MLGHVMNEQSLLTWFEQIKSRIFDFHASPTADNEVWATLFTERQTALESIFPSSHSVLRRWEDALSRGKQAVKNARLQIKARQSFLAHRQVWCTEAKSGHIA